MKRALLVGIDRYDEVFERLYGCVNDVEAVLPLFEQNEDQTRNFDCIDRTSTKDRITRKRLLSDIDGLLSGGADVGLFYFAGHGADIADDVSLVTQDATDAATGVRLSEVFLKINRSDVKEVIVILDACFAGDAGSGSRVRVDTSGLRSGVSVLTASRGDQASAETAPHHMFSPDKIGDPAVKEKPRGLFSTYLEWGLLGGAADVLGNVNVAGIYAYVTESFNAWEQRPVFKANLDELHVLRRVTPSVSPADLLKLPKLFSQADSVFALDPTYEVTDPSADPDRVATFQLLQRCRAARLVEPVGEDHLYWAAMRRKSCRLTGLGQHYRLLAERRMI